MGFQLHCNDEPLSGELPRAATHIFHRDVYDCRANAAFYLFTLRDPLERIRAAFIYGREAESRAAASKAATEKIYYDCPYIVVEELATFGLADGGAASAECRRRARDLLRGTALSASHAYYNYQYYLEALPRGAEVLVVRAEHAEEDWDAVERGLGGGASRRDLAFPRIDAPRQRYARDAMLGAEARRLLCRELCVEVQYYKLLLRRARNLDAAQYETSMGELRVSCPEEARKEQCDFHTPNIKSKLLDTLGRRRNETRHSAKLEVEKATTFGI